MKPNNVIKFWSVDFEPEVGSLFVKKRALASSNGMNDILAPN